MRRVLTVLAVVLALVSAACGDDAGEATADTTPDTSAASTSPPDTTSTETAPPDTDPTEATTTAPATTTTVEWEEVAGGPDCASADGSDWSFWVREADPARVLLYFQGGGACFSAETCAFDSGSYKVTGGAADDPSRADGIFELDRGDTPFADWSIVFVPYCTGDVHIGTATDDYGDGLVVEHKGFVNGSWALDELVTRFPDADEVFVTGSSAGGVLSPLFAGLVADRLPDAAVTALADGSGVYPDVPAVNAGIGGLWGTLGAVPDWRTTQEVTAEDWSIPGLFVYAGLHQPDIAMARFDHAFDEVQSDFSSLAGVGADDLVSLIDQNAAEIVAAGVEVATYVAPGDDHTILATPELYTLEVEGVAFLDWLTGLATGEPAPDVCCTDCQG